MRSHPIMAKALSEFGELDLEQLDWSDTELVKSLVLALIHELQETRAELQETREELGRVKKRLAFYENPHTPPSQRKLKKKPKSKSANRKRGAPVGHKGVSRPRRETAEIIIVPADKCESCGSRNLKHLRRKEKTIEDTAAVPEPEAKTFIRDKVQCRDCGHIFTAKHPKCPTVGRLGVNLMVFIVMLKFLPRSVLRKTVELLEHIYHIKITAATTHNVITRVAEGAGKEYQRILQRIRAAKVVYVDETGFSVLGKTWWLWIYRSADEVAVVIRDSRGGNVVREILGEDFADVVVRDGWRAYNTLKHALAQRCWSHLLREAKQYVDTVAGRHLYEKLSEMFTDIKDFNAGQPRETQRKHRYLEFNTQMKRLLDYYSRYPGLDKIVTYTRNGGGSWFTCVLVEGVEPTNNLGEQAMREHVIVRKIIGALRSTNGAKVYETLASLIATWRLRNENIPDKLKQIITQNLCQTKN